MMNLQIKGIGRMKKIEYRQDELHRVVALRKALDMLDRAEKDVDYWIDDYFGTDANGLPTMDDIKRVKRELSRIGHMLSDLADGLKVE